MDKSSVVIQTFSGKLVNPFELRVEDISLIDIAHSLSNLCRYTGHCSEFYSVAEHSVYVSQHVSAHFALAALLHDASEAYTNDISKLVKRALPDVRALESHVEKIICMKFRISRPTTPEIKEIDEAVFAAEHAVLMPNTWTPDITPAPIAKINCWDPETAKQKFIERYTELTYDVLKSRSSVA